MGVGLGLCSGLGIGLGVGVGSGSGSGLGLEVDAVQVHRCTSPRNTTSSACSMRVTPPAAISSYVIPPSPATAAVRTLGLGVQSPSKMCLLPLDLDDLGRGSRACAAGTGPYGHWALRRRHSGSPGGGGAIGSLGGESREVGVGRCGTAKTGAVSSQQGGAASQGMCEALR